MSQMITIYLDQALNANDRLHWRTKADLTRKIRHEAHWMAKARLTPVAGRQHVTATFGFTINRRRDVGNLYPTVKAALDGITDAAIWPDDNDTWIEGPDLRCGPKSDRPHAIRLDITLEDA